MLSLPLCRYCALACALHSCSITFHKAVGWSIAFFSVLHTAAHMRNFALFAQSTKTGFVGFLFANFATGPVRPPRPSPPPPPFYGSELTESRPDVQGVTGWLMTAILGTMIWFAMEKRRRANFERFWYSHHLFVLFFALWQLHVRSSIARICYLQILKLILLNPHLGAATNLDRACSA